METMTILIDNIFDICVEDNKIMVVSKRSKKELVIYPAMWNECTLDNSKIYISDKLISKELPSSYYKIKTAVN